MDIELAYGLKGVGAEDAAYPCSADAVVEQRLVCVGP